MARFGVTSNSVEGIARPLNRSHGKRRGAPRKAAPMSDNDADDMPSRKGRQAAPVPDNDA